MNRIELQFNFLTDFEILYDRMTSMKTSRLEKKMTYMNIRNYQNALKILDSELINGYISSKIKILRLINNRRLKECMSEFIDTFNEKSDDVTYNDGLCYKIRNSLVNYYLILDKYKINRSSINNIILEKYSYVDLDCYLSILIYKYILDRNIALDVLATSSVDRIFGIINLLSKYTFHIDYLFDFNNFFLKLCDLNSDAYDNFSSNILLLSEYDLLPVIDHFVAGFLFSNKKILSNNLEILKKYNLLNNIKGLDNKFLLFNILTMNNLDENLDIILEMGCFEFLMNNISSLEFSSVKRLQLLKCIGTPVLEQETYDTTMTSCSFVLNDNELDSQIETAVQENLDIKLNITLDELEQFRLLDNENLYSIGGVLVSYNKVKRLVNKGNSIYNSIVSGLILSDLEYENLMHELKPFVYVK